MDHLPFNNTTQRTVTIHYYSLSKLLEKEVTILHPNGNDSFKITPEGVQAMLNTPRSSGNHVLIPAEVACESLGIVNGVKYGVALLGVSTKHTQHGTYLGFWWVGEE